MKLTKSLSLLLAVFMVLSLFPVGAFAAESTTPAVAYQQLSLSDDLTMRFYVTAQENTTVNVTVDGNTVAHDLSKLTADSEGYYVIPVELAAAQMTEAITLDFVVDGASVLQETYTVRDYAVSILEGNESNRTKGLVRQMLHYGTAAQQYFGINTDNLANVGYALNETEVFPAEYAPMAVEGSIAGIRFYGATLAFESKIAVRYYFAADSVEGVTFTANGASCQADKKNGLYYVEVPGINPQDYANSISLSAVKGTETLTVSYSPLNYMIRMSEKGGESLKLLLNALYGYHEAAVKYVTETTFFGEAFGHETTEHLDLSADTGANNGTVTVSENGVAFGYIDSFLEDDFYFETKIHVNGILETEGYPKFGLMVENGDNREYLYVDMTTDLTAGVVGRMTNTNGTDDWANAKSVAVSNMAFSGEGEAVTLGVLKEGKRLYFFVDGAYVMTSTTSFDGSAMAGIFSFNTGMTVTEYYTDTTQQTIEDKKTLIPSYELTKGDTFGFAQGDGITYETTGEVELGTDNGADPSVRFYGGAPRYAYLNDVYTDKFCFETEINVESVLNGDAWPKFGLMVNGASEMVKFFVDMTPELTATHVGVVYQPTGGGDDWGGSVSCEVPGMSFAGTDTVKLKLIRDGRAYFFYVNDALVMYNDAGFKAERGAVGIFSFNTVLTASSYWVSAGVNADSDIQSATGLGLTCNWFADNGNGSYTLSTDSDAQHKVDDLTRGGYVLREDFYRVSGKLTLTDAANWGQARILISSDAQNEYFIALEKHETGNYQIFSMSKAVQDSWDVWELIRSEAEYGARNSLDFELVVMGGTVYLLIDGTVAYTTSRVSMATSTVKFTGYNIGTTTVENLSAQVFANQDEAESYLAQKVLAQDMSNVFYRNGLSTVGADPSAIYISEGVDAGSYYMYVTSDELSTKGFLAYRSSDLVNWECVGTALSTFEQYDESTGITTVSYATANYWAPEVIYDSETDLYYLFYSATRKINGSTRFYGDIAVSETPAGPFIPYNQYLGNEPVVLDEANKIVAYAPVFDFANMDPSHPLYESGSNGYMKVIDMCPFVDPVSGRKYMYFCHDLAKELNIATSSIYVMALNDDYTPDYTKVYALTTANCLELNGTYDETMGEGSVNEAPYVVYNAQSEKYYLFYSVNAYYEQTYSTRVAVADSPVGPFRKLTQAEGGWLLYAESHWTWASGTGHCSVVNRNGQDYVVYHAHKPSDDESTLRGIAMDALHWVQNSDGLLVPVVSGPTITDSPLTTNSYQNIASCATVTATNVAQGTVDALTDGIISCHDSEFISDTVFNGDSATVTLQFDGAQTVWGIAVFNGSANGFRNIQSIKLQLVGGGYVVYNNLTNVWHAEDGSMICGGSVALGFVPLQVTAIEIIMPATDAQYAISDIAVMTKR